MLSIILLGSILVIKATADTGEFSFFCTKQAIDSRKVFKSYPYDRRKFILCTGVGQFIIASCDPGQVFSAQKLRCVSDQPVITTPPAIRCTTPSGIDVSFSGIPLTPGFTGECYINPSTVCDHWYRRFVSQQEMLIQCSSTGKHLLLRCLPGLKWNDQLKICGGKTIIDPINCPVPSWVNPSESGLPLDVPNPCPATSKCNVYLAYPFNLHKFIECSKNGVGVIKSCPLGWNWLSASQACGADSGRTVSPVDKMPQCGSNPCRKSKTGLLSMSEMYHNCPGSNKHFIVCDPWGNKFVKQCRDNLDWSEEAFTCGPAHVVGK